jgi:hypothetical protein
MAKKAHKQQPSALDEVRRHVRIFIDLGRVASESADEDGPRLPHRRDRLVRRLEEISDHASARNAARAFRAWAIAEGLLSEQR